MISKKSFQLYCNCPEKNNRIEVNMLIVYKSNLTESPLEIHIRDEHLDIDLPIPLSEIDIERFGIKEGDIIDYAYWQNHMTKGAVVWRHSIPHQSLSQMLEEKAEKEKVKTPSKKADLIVVYTNFIGHMPIVEH